MKEAQIRREIFNLMRRLWLWPLTQTDLRPVLSSDARRKMNYVERRIKGQAKWLQPRWYAFKKAILASTQQPPSGRPDIPSLNPTGPSIAVEVKAFPLPRKRSVGSYSGTTFSFSTITASQRQWLNNFQEDADRGHGPGAYLALGMRHGQAGAKKLPRHLWLVPWSMWLRVEDKLRTYQESLPLNVIKGLRKEIQENKLTAYRLLKPWALEWYDSCWHLPANHPLQVFITCQGERNLDEEKLRWQKTH